MPELKCTVQTCVHNQKFLCDLDSISGRRSECEESAGDMLRQLSGEKGRDLYEFHEFDERGFRYVRC